MDLQQEEINKQKNYNLIVRSLVFVNLTEMKPWRMVK